MSKEYYCPKCHNQLTYYQIVLNPGEEIPKYKHYFRCDKCQDLNYDEELIKKLEPNLFFDFGKINKRSYKMYCNCLNCKVAFAVWEGSERRKYGIYDYSDISIEISNKTQTIYKTNGLVPMIIGGVLFGGAGAIGGSIIGANKKAVREKEIYTITISVYDTVFTGFVLQTEDKSFVHDFVVKAEILRKHASANEEQKMKKQEEQVESDNKESVFDKVVELKKLYDEGFIDKQTYEEKKKKYIDLL